MTRHPISVRRTMGPSGQIQPLRPIPQSYLYAQRATVRGLLLGRTYSHAGAHVWRVRNAYIVRDSRSNISTRYPTAPTAAGAFLALALRG
jgi:hypothetical protein